MAGNVQNNGSSDLFDAVETGKVSSVKRLLEAGIDINQQNEHGETVLYTAVENDNPKLVKLLLQKGAIVNYSESDADEPLLFLAVKVGNPAIVHLLLENGSDINQQDYDGKTALHVAAAKKNLEMYKELLLTGADINKQDYDGKPADYYIKEKDKHLFNKIKKEIDTLKGVAAFNHMHPNPRYTYEMLQAEDIKNLHDYLGGKQIRKTTKRRKTTNKNLRNK